MTVKLDTTRRIPQVLLVGGPYDARVFSAHKLVEVGTTIQVAAGPSEVVHTYLIETMGAATYVGVDGNDTEGMVESYLSAPAADPTK